MDKRQEADLDRDWAEYEEVMRWAGDLSPDARWIGFMLYRIHRDTPAEAHRRISRGMAARPPMVTIKKD
jgi:hypothetical protein